MSVRLHLRRVEVPRLLRAHAPVVVAVRDGGDGLGGAARVRNGVLCPDIHSCVHLLPDTRGNTLFPTNKSVTNNLFPVVSIRLHVIRFRRTLIGLTVTEGPGSKKKHCGQGTFAAGMVAATSCARNRRSVLLVCSRLTSTVATRISHRHTIIVPARAGRW